MSLFCLETLSAIEFISVVGGLCACLRACVRVWVWVGGGLLEVIYPEMVEPYGLPRIN